MSRLEQFCHYAGEDITHLFVMADVHYVQYELAPRPRGLGLVLVKKSPQGSAITHELPEFFSLEQLQEALGYLVDTAAGIPHPIPHYPA